jgi:8-oxo-dGTP pyrophosphatase MutT (NUDIX family)
MTTDQRERFSTAAIREKLGGQGGKEDASQYGDHLLNPDLLDHVGRMTLRDAAVLVPFMDHGDHTSLLLTQRTANMRTHSGQIAFPGGAIDPWDASAEAAAIREAEEEIGLPPSRVETIGRLPQYLSGSGFRITPVIAIVQPGFRFHLNRQEVDDAFEVPFDFLMDPAHHIRESKEWQGIERHYYTMPYHDRFIWGVTAGIIRTLYELHFSR